MHFTNDEIRAYQKKARAYASAHGEGNCADDFAQEAIVKILSGRKATIAQLFIDFVRQQYGDTGRGRSALGQLKSAGIREAKSFDQPISRESESTLFDVLVAPEPDPGHDRHDWRARNSFGEREGLIADMRYDDEMLESEIAWIFGVTESRICQIIKRVNKKIESSAIIARCYDNYKNNENYSKLHINWITI